MSLVMIIDTSVPPAPLEIPECELVFPMFEGAFGQNRVKCVMVLLGR